MPYVTLSSAILITGLSKRTLWRRISDGSLRASGGEPGERTRVDLDDVLALSSLQLNDDERALIVAADAGKAEAECDLGLLLLVGGGRSSNGVAWLDKAARQFYPEAMYWLGRCLIAGRGVEEDVAAGVGWIEKAADHGHVIAVRLAGYLDEVTHSSLSGVALDAALDMIEREVVLKALVETADR